MSVGDGRMLVQEHLQTAVEFLEASDREFEAGDILQGSEKLWGAAAHAVMAAAQEKGWAHGGHRDLKNAVENLSREYNDPLIKSLFAVAEKFHRNFYNNTMPDFEIEGDRPMVRDFVERVRDLLSQQDVP